MTGLCHCWIGSLLPQHRLDVSRSGLRLQTIFEFAGELCVEAGIQESSRFLCVAWLSSWFCLLGSLGCPKRLHPCNTLLFQNQRLVLSLSLS